jgi:hypothetical protein
MTAYWGASLIYLTISSVVKLVQHVAHFGRRKIYLSFWLARLKADIYVYCAVLKRLTTPSDFYIPLPSIVPFAHS